jgi:hypothetical protein
MLAKKSHTKQGIRKRKNPKANLVPKNAMMFDSCKSNVMQDNYKPTNLCN